MTSGRHPATMLDLGGTAQQVASVTGASGSVIQLNGVQHRHGHQPATFAGSFTGSGSIQVNGTLRLVGNASIAPDNGSLGGFHSEMSRQIIQQQSALYSRFVSSILIIGKGVVGVALGGVS
jgi:hypothetical protein